MEGDAEISSFVLSSNFSILYSDLVTGRFAAIHQGLPWLILVRVNKLFCYQRSIWVFFIGVIRNLSLSSLIVIMVELWEVFKCLLLYTMFLRISMVVPPASGYLVLNRLSCL